MNTSTDKQRLKTKIPVYYCDLTRYAFSLIKNQDDAQDLVQETYFKAYKYFDKFTYGTNVRAWLYRILYNQFCSQNRKKINNLDEISEDYIDVSTVVQNSISKTEIIESIHNLDTKYRNISLLYFTEEFSYLEIKKVTGLKLGTVKSRIYRSRELLRDEISQRNRNKSYLKAV